MVIEGPDGPGSFRLIACAALSHERRQDRSITPGESIACCMREELGWSTESLNARVFIDGEFVPEAVWETTRPTNGQAVVIRRIPQGGGGGKSGQRLGAMLALVAASWFISGGGLGAFLPEALGMAVASGTAVLAGAVLVGGTLALNALFAPPRPRLPVLSGQGAESRTLLLDGATNELTPYGRIPRVYGRHRVYPILAARPFTETVGNAQYLNLLFCFGYGPLTLSDVRIGSKPLTDFAPDYQEERRRGHLDDPPLTISSQDVDTQNFESELRAGVFIQKTSADNARKLSIDLEFPNGLLQVGPSGERLSRTVAFDVQYRKVGTTPWLTVGGPTGSPAVKASFTTNLAGGPNSNVTFTMKQAGAFGNRYSMGYSPGNSINIIYSQDLPQYERDQLGLDDYQTLIRVNFGSTTAAQVKAAVDAHPTLSQLFDVTFVGTGAGAITLSGSTWHYMRGGLDGFGATTVTRASSTLVRHPVEWVVGEAGVTYEVQVRRNTADSTDLTISDRSFWRILRTHQDSAPVTKPGMSLFALRIKATDQLNGVVDSFNAIAQSVLPDWDATLGQWVERETANPASIYRDVLQGRANSRPKSDDRLDLSTIQEFHTRCAQQGFTFNAVIDFQTTVKQLRQDVLAVGRATFGLRDMKYSVVQDVTQATPVDIITPRTSSSFRWTRRFVEVPHGLKVRFVDESLESDWKQREAIVYSSGYTAANATIFQDADAGVGVTNYEHMVKLKSRELAELSLRADDYEVEVDFSNLSYTRGDFVKLQHDVILAGLVSARIKSVTLNGSSQATSITFDEFITMEAGKSYGARIRRSNGAQLVQPIVTSVGQWSFVDVSSPIPVGSVPSVGDLVTLGELGKETIDCIVKSIRPGPDYTATVVLMDDAPTVRIAETLQQLPPYDPQISVPAQVLTPTIVQVRSDESVLTRSLDGALESRILVSVHFTSGFQFPASRIETQFRVQGSDVDWKTIFSDVVGGSVEIPVRPVEDGLTYELRLRAVDDRSGAFSPWTGALVHTVVGKTTPPPDVPTLVIEGDRLRWDYPNPPPDLAGFVVRFRAGNLRQWEDATEAHSQIILTTDFQILSQQGQQTWMVKAVDVAGNESLNPAVVVFNLGDQLFDNVVVTVDHKVLGFPGTKTNCSVVSTNLEANSSTPFWGPDPSLFWSTDGASLFWGGLFSTMTYEWSYGPALDLLDASLKLDWTISGNYIVEYRTDSSALMWNADSATQMWNVSAATPMWSPKGDYIAWPGVLSPLTYQQYEFRITGFGGTEQVVVEQLQVILDVPDIVEVFPDVLVSAAGTRLSLANPYRAIVAVQLTLQDDGGTAAYVKTMDKDLTLGPLVQAFTTADVATAGLVDATVQGY
jgi:hypothetical protein